MPFAEMNVRRLVRYGWSDELRNQAQNPTGARPGRQAVEQRGDEDGSRRRVMSVCNSPRRDPSCSYHAERSWTHDGWGKGHRRGKSKFGYGLANRESVIRPVPAM